MDITELSENLIGFGLILTRLSAFFLILPIFGWRILPVRIKMALVLLLTIFFGRSLPFSMDLHGVSTLRMILMMINEATYGLALGLIIAILFNIVKTSGRIIERQMGMAMAEVIDPLSGERTQPLGGLLEMIFVLFVLNANAHHSLIRVIHESFQSFPVGTIPTIEVLTRGVVEAGRVLLTAGLQLAAPILAAFIILLVVLAIMARVVPEMNILFLSMPVRVGMGLAMSLTVLPYLQGLVDEIGNFMNKLLPL